MNLRMETDVVDSGYLEDTKQWKLTNKIKETGK